MTANPRSIEIEIEVPGTSEEVWQAIATGPGVSSWYVPHEIEEYEGGAAIASFGPEPEMQAHGTVAAWDPPRRLVIDSGEGGPGLAFEWLVEAKDGGTCVVRLVNSGFGDGDEWDAQYEAMAEGWKMFLTGLRLHLEYFAPKPASALLPMAMWPAGQVDSWSTLTGALGIPAEPAAGERITVTGDGAPELSGVVVQSTPHRLSLLIDAPAAGTGFIAAEGHGVQSAVSIWYYLYGDDREAIATRDDPRWRQWLEQVAPTM